MLICLETGAFQSKYILYLLKPYGLHVILAVIWRSKDKDSVTLISLIWMVFLIFGSCKYFLKIKYKDVEKSLNSYVLKVIWKSRK